MNGPNDGHDRLLNVTEAAARLGVRKSWIYEQTRRLTAAAIPHVRIGRYVKFVPAALDQWVAQQTIGGTPAQPSGTNGATPPRSRGRRESKVSTAREKHTRGGLADDETSFQR